MSTIPKTYPQVALPANTLTAIRTMEASTYMTNGSIWLCNRTAGVINVRMSIAVAGAVDDVSQYILYDCPLKARETKCIGGGIGIGPTDQIRVRPSAVGVSATVSGLVTTP